MVKQPEDQFDELHDGKFQFSSVCRILREFDFQCSLEALRAEIVSYLVANPNDLSGTPLDFYMDVPFTDYLNCMSVDGTCGDEVTLRVVDELLNTEFIINFSLARAAEATITPQNFAPQGQ